MKPVFNYELSISDRINQITNQPHHGVVKLIFPASFGDDDVRAALRDACFLVDAELDESIAVDNSGREQDLYYEVKVDDHEHYSSFMSTLFGILWNDESVKTPIAVVYIPSKEEVNL